ncbi:MAG: FecR family protein [Alphaproteobacteria bacterium]|nr:FecR family protein [Alphaproteobacteria bacterium]
MNKSALGLIALTIAATLPGAAWADDWQVAKLRGAAAELVDGSWRPIHRGDVISDDRAVQTLDGGRLSLRRGRETIDLGPNTAIRIKDRDGQQYTTVNQYFGTVEVEAEVRDVKHFAVVTPMLAAVVKGTRFTVTSGEHSAGVSVQRGQVAVEDSDTGQSVLLAKDQSATTTDEGGPLEVSGDGDLPKVFNAQGKEIAIGKASAPGQLKKSGTSNAATGKGVAGTSNAGGNSNGNGNSGSSNAGGNAGSSNAGGNGNGNSGSGNAGGKDK